MSTAVTCQPRVASQIASTPSPQPTSSARPASSVAASATSWWFGLPLQIDALAW
jgi:hypothetical protein